MSTEPKEPVQLCEGYWERRDGGCERIYRITDSCSPYGWRSGNWRYTQSGKVCDGAPERPTDLVRFLGPLDPKECVDCKEEFWPEIKGAVRCPSCHSILVEAMRANSEPPQPAVGQVWKLPVDCVCIEAITSTHAVTRLIHGHYAGVQSHLPLAALGGAELIDPSRVPFWPGQVWETRGGIERLVHSISDPQWPNTPILVIPSENKRQNYCKNGAWLSSGLLGHDLDLVKFLRWKGFPAEPKETTTTTTQESENMLIVKETPGTRLAQPGELFKVWRMGSGDWGYGVVHSSQAPGDTLTWSATYLESGNSMAVKGVNVGTVRKDQALYVPALEIRSVEGGSNAPA